MRYRYLLLALLWLAIPSWAAVDEACAVCSARQERYHLESCSFSTTLGGKTYHFCEQACLDTFQEDPEQWAARFEALEKGERTAAELPAFRFPLEPFGSLSSQDVAGKVLVLNLWATWCEPCMAEMPDLVRLQNEYGDRGLAVIALSFDKTKEAHRKGLGDLKLTFPSVFADQKAVQDFLAELGKVSAIPVTFVVDSEGKIVKRMEGKQSFEAFVEAVEPLLPAPAEDPKQEARHGSVAPS